MKKFRLKKIITTIGVMTVLCLMPLTCFSACVFKSAIAIRGSGNMISQEFELATTITAIDIDKVGATVNITDIDSDKVTYSIDDNLAEKLSISQESSGVLTIKSNARRPLGNNRAITFNIGTKQLWRLTAKYNVKIVGGGTFEAESFLLDTSGNSDVNLLVNAKSAKFYTSGSSKLTITGNIDTIVSELSGSGEENFDVVSKSVKFYSSGSNKTTLKGLTNILEFKSSGSSKLLAKDCVAQDVNIETSGSSKVETTVEKKLKVRASGTTKVTYWGEPAVEQSISGAGKVVKG